MFLTQFSLHKIAFTLLVALLLVGCDSPNIELGYQPPLIPIKISVNQNGQVSLSASHSVTTFIGTFDISGGSSIYDLRQKIDDPVLIVQVDGQITVYELEPGQRLEVSLNDGTLYEQVDLDYEPDGDIVLRVQSVKLSTNRSSTSSSSNHSSSSAPPSSSTSNIYCPGAFEPRVYIGATVQVVAVPRLYVREGPSTSYDTVYGSSIKNGRTATVIDGPECDEGMLWWKIETGTITLTDGNQTNMIGWVAEESGNEWMIEPIR